jgi:putative adhesin
MADIVNDKPPRYEPPVDERGTNAVDTGAERTHRLKKVLALFMSMILLLWLFNCGWRKPYILHEANHWDLRKRQIDTGSQSLTADFDLLDLLSIRSSSGSLSIGVHPQPADKENPVPAELLVRSSSGSVNVNFLAFAVPAREYQVSINSDSGSIGGTILHGRKTSIASKSSGIHVQLAPYESGDYASTLNARTVSGHQGVTVLSPSLHPGTSIKAMSSFHSTESGSLALRYPREWEGTIEGRTGSGSLNLHGNDVDIISQSGHYVYAKKGNGSSRLSFHTESGSADVYFG